MPKKGFRGFLFPRLLNTKKKREITPAHFYLLRFRLRKNVGISSVSSPV